MKILVLRFSAMGDVAMTVPVVESVLKSNPNLEIVYVSRKNFAPFFMSMPKNFTFVGVDFKDYEGFFGLRRLFKELKEYKVDALVDLHDVLRTKILRTFFRLTGVKCKVIDKGRKQKEELCRQKNKIVKPLKSSIERYADVFRKLGLDFEMNFTSIFPKKLENKVKKVGIAPFAKHVAKTYPIEKMEKVLSQLNEKGYEIFLFGGGKQEKEILDEWASKYPNATNLCGKYTLEKEMQFISTLDVMISMDSANMHIASLCGVRCISIWGATHYFAGFLGYNQSKDDIVEIPLDELPCRPCSVFGNKPCAAKRDYACMNYIKSASILEKI